MKPVLFAREAESELADIASWYESRNPALADELLDEVDRILPLISKRPSSFPALLDTPIDLRIRRGLLPRFPYALVFTETAAELRIIAVAHHKREPGYWLDRIRE